MKLGAYKINNTPVSEMKSVEVADLKGKAPFVIADKLPSGYKDITSIQNLHAYGKNLVGSTTGFRDWKCLQREIKALVMDKVKDDLTGNWKKLSKEEKEIACRYMLGKISPAAFAEAIPDVVKRNELSAEFDRNTRAARGSWSAATGRVQAVRLLFFEKLGPATAMEAMGEMVQEGLFTLYEGGIEGSEEDGLVGINDFLQARKKTPYATTGLKKRKYPIVDGSKDTVKELADNLTNIINNGLY